MCLVLPCSMASGHYLGAMNSISQTLLTRYSTILYVITCNKNIKCAISHNYKLDKIYRTCTVHSLKLKTQQKSWTTGMGGPDWSKLNCYLDVMRNSLLSLWWPIPDNGRRSDSSNQISMIGSHLGRVTSYKNITFTHTSKN